MDCQIVFLLRSFCKNLWAPHCFVTKGRYDYCLVAGDDQATRQSKRLLPRPLAHSHMTSTLLILDFCVHLFLPESSAYPSQV